MFLLTNIPEISIVPRGMSREMSTALPTVKVLSRKLLNFVEPEEVFQHFFAEEAYAFWLDSSRVESDLSRFSCHGSQVSFARLEKVHHKPSFPTLVDDPPCTIRDQSSAKLQVTP